MCRRGRARRSPTVTTSSNWRNLVAACAAISVFGLAFGMTYPLLSLILESRGVGTDMIGINAAMMPIGILLFSSTIPVATRRFGAVASLVEWDEDIPDWDSLEAESLRARAVQREALADPQRGA